MKFTAENAVGWYETQDGRPAFVNRFETEGDVSYLSGGVMTSDLTGWVVAAWTDNGNIIGAGSSGRLIRRKLFSDLWLPPPPAFGAPGADAGVEHVAVNQSKEKFIAELDEVMRLVEEQVENIPPYPMHPRSVKTTEDGRPDIPAAIQAEQFVLRAHKPVPADQQLADYAAEQRRTEPNAHPEYKPLYIEPIRKPIYPGTIYAEEEKKESDS